LFVDKVIELINLPVVTQDKLLETWKVVDPFYPVLDYEIGLMMVHSYSTSEKKTEVAFKILEPNTSSSFRSSPQKKKATTSNPKKPKGYISAFNFFLQDARSKTSMTGKVK